jgi:tetratricopeptide (TPR) repeat protein
VRRTLVAAVLALGLAATAAAQDDASSDAAEQRLRDRVEATQGTEKGAAAAELARLLESQTRWSEAASAWRQARKLRGDLADVEGEARAVLGFAEDVTAQGESAAAVSAAFEDAKTALRRARDAGSKSIDVALGLARCAEVAGDDATRIAELTSAYQSSPKDDVRAAHALAAAQAVRGAGADALGACQMLADAHPGDVELALALHDAAERANDETKRREGAVRAVRAAPADVRGWSALWKLYVPKSRWGELADVYVELASAHADGPWGPRYAGIACSQARRYDEALTWLQKAWDRSRKDAVARTEAAKILHYQKLDRPGALAMYREALAADPRNAEAYAGVYAMAVRYDAESDKKAAARIFEILAKERPNDPLAQNNYANSLRFAGRYDDSEREYLAAIAAFPTDAQLRNDYALLLDVEGRGDDARRVLVAAHEVDPANNDSMENLAFLARAKGERDEALKWFRMARAALVARGEDDHKHRINVDDQRWPLAPLR